METRPGRRQLPGHITVGAMPAHTSPVLSFPLSFNIVIKLPERRINRIKALMGVDGDVEIKLAFTGERFVIVAAVDKKTGDVIKISKLPSAVIFGARGLTSIIPNNTRY